MKTTMDERDEERRKDEGFGTANYDLAHRGGGQNRTLPIHSMETLSGELNADYIRHAIRVETASRPTEKLTRPVNEMAGGTEGQSYDADSGTNPISSTTGHVEGESGRTSEPAANGLKNVVLHIQQLASDALLGQGVRWEVVASPELDRIHLSSEQCLHLFSIFEEALQNIARHAQCSAVSLGVSVRQQRLEIKIHDNGRGLIGNLLGNSVVHRRAGGGLRKIRSRVAELGGALEIASAPDRGTSLTLTLPLSLPFQSSMNWPRWGAGAN